MSLNTTYDNEIIIGDLVIDADEPTVLEEIGGTNADGWDTVTRSMVYLTTFVDALLEDFVAFAVNGYQLPGRQLYCQGMKNFKCRARGLFTWEETYLGIASNKPVVVDYDSSADQQQGENIVTPDGFFEHVMTHENTPTASVRYVVTDITTAPTANVGRATTPPSAPAVAPTVWTFLTKFTYHWPNGWVLMGSKTTRLPGTTIALVEDRYQYIRPLTPRT